MRPTVALKLTASGGTVVAGVTVVAPDVAAVAADPVDVAMEMAPAEGDSDAAMDGCLVVEYLTRTSSHDELKVYLNDKHASLVPLLPEDTTANDLFQQVEDKQDIAEFFEASTDSKVRRAFSRLVFDIKAFLKEVHLAKNGSEMV